MHSEYLWPCETLHYHMNEPRAADCENISQALTAPIGSTTSDPISVPSEE